MKIFLNFLFFSVGWFFSDIITYLSLKYIKKDKSIYGVKYGLNWWPYYFTNNYRS